MKQQVDLSYEQMRYSHPTGKSIGSEEVYA